MLRPAIKPIFLILVILLISPDQGLTSNNMTMSCDNPVQVNYAVTCYLDIQLECQEISIQTDFGAGRIFYYSASQLQYTQRGQAYNYGYPSINLPAERQYWALNTELTEDMNVTYIYLHGQQAGLVDLELISYPLPTAYGSVADQIVATGIAPSGTILYSEDVTITTGFQAHYLPTPIYCPKGTMLVITMHSGLLSINSYQSPYSDFNWLGISLDSLPGTYSVAAYIYGVKSELATATSLSISPTALTELGPQLISATFICNDQTVYAEYQTYVSERPNSLDVGYSTSVITKGETVDFNFNLGFACPATTFNVDFGDGSAVKYYPTKYRTFGLVTPDSLQQGRYTQVSSGKEYLAINSEIRSDSFVTGFEFYVIQPGSITFEFLSFDQNTNGYTLTDYFAVHGVLPSYVDRYDGAYTVTLNLASAGYYNYTFPQPVFYPYKTAVNLKFVTGSLALDTSGMYNGYPDVEWDRSTYTKRIQSGFNPMFYLNIITNETMTGTYSQQFSIRRQFLNTGSALVKSSFNCNAERSYEFYVQVNERPNTIGISSSSTNIQTSERVDLYYSLTFPCSSTTFLVNFGGEGTVQYFPKSFQTYGLIAPDSLQSGLFKSVASGKEYLALFAEIRQDSYITGFEFYVVQPGDITFEFLSFETNANGYTLSDYLAVYGSLPLYTDRYGGAYTVTRSFLTPGYYSHEFSTPVFFPMRTAINMKFTSGALALETTGLYGGYSDIEWDRATYTTRIYNDGYSTVFYLNIITNTPKTGSDSQNIIIRRQFSNQGNFLVHASFFCNYEVTNDLNVQVNQQPSTISMSWSTTSIMIYETIDFYYYLSSSCPVTSFDIDFGDGNSTRYYPTNFQTYGLITPTSIQWGRYATVATGKEYLALNAEITEDRYVTAFEFYVIQPGEITFEFLSFGQTTNGYRLTDFLAVYGYLPAYQDRYSGAYTLTQTFAVAGYYNHTFAAPVFFPAKTVVNMKFTSGSIALERNGMYGGYSDVQWDHATMTTRRIIDTYNNLFYFNFITNNPKGIYQNQQVFLRRKFLATGSLTVHASFFCVYEATSDLSVTVNEKPNSISLSPSTSSVVVLDSVYLYFSLLFPCPSITLNIDLGDGSSVKFFPKSYQTFGLITSDILQPNQFSSVPAGKEYLALYAEIREDSYITSFEFYVVQPGDITFEFLSFDATINGYTLTDYLSVYGSLPLYTDRYGGAYTVTKTFLSPGYYTHEFAAPVFFPMRTVINMKFTSGALAVDTSGIYGGNADVEWDRATYTTRILTGYGNFFFLNIITNTPKAGYDNQNVIIKKQYTTVANYIVHASFMCNSEVTSDLSISVIERPNTLSASYSNSVIKVNQTIDFYFYLSFPCSDTTLNVDFGDGSVGLKYPATNFQTYGMIPPDSLQTGLYNTISVGKQYLAMYAEIREDSYVTAFEFYVVQPGVITFELLSFNPNQNYYSMSDYYNSYGILPGYTDRYAGAYTITQTFSAAGYYRYTFPEPVFYPKRTIMNLKFETGSIALADTSGTYGGYSDFEWDGTTVTSRILSTYNNLFYLNIITNRTKIGYDTQNIYFRRQFFVGGNFLVHTCFMCNVDVSYDMSIQVKEDNNVSPFCGSSSYQFNTSLNCGYYLEFTCPDIQFKTDFGDGTYLLYHEISNLAFGRPVLMNTNLPVDSSTLFSTYYGLNSEVLEDSYITSFEFYLAQAGTVSFEFTQYDPLIYGPYGSVAEFMRQTRDVPQSSGVITTVTIQQSPAGFNVYTFPVPIYCPKGTMVAVLNQEGLIAMSNVPQHSYSDKEWSIASTSDRSAMYLRLIRDTSASPSYREFYFMKTYEVASGQFSVIGSFNCDGTVYSNTQLFDIVGGPTTTTPELNSTEPISETTESSTTYIPSSTTELANDTSSANDSSTSTTEIISITTYATDNTTSADESTTETTSFELSTTTELPSSTSIIIDSSNTTTLSADTTVETATNGTADTSTDTTVETSTGATSDTTTEANSDTTSGTVSDTTSEATTETSPETTTGTISDTATETTTDQTSSIAPSQSSTEPVTSGTTVVVSSTVVPSTISSIDSTTATVDVTATSADASSSIATNLQTTTPTDSTAAPATTSTTTQPSEGCASPTLSIDGFSTDPNTPTNLNRYDTMSVPAITTFNCVSSFTFTRTWTLKLIDSSRNVLSTVDLSTNPSVSTSQLVVQGNTLSYGLFEIEYTVTVVDSTNTALTSNVNAYVEIEPSGIVVYGLENGVPAVSIGTAQSLSLLPNSYSIDADKFVSPSSLVFAYNCRTKDSGTTYGPYPTDSSGVVSDLKSQMTNGFTYSYGCFSSSSGYTFDSNGGLIIQPNSLAFVLNRDYEFLIETTYLGTVYNQIITVSVQDVPIVPQVTLKCRMENACFPLPAFKRFSDDKQLIIDSACTEGCDTALRATHQFDIFMNTGTLSNPIWTSYSDSSNLLSGASTTSLMIPPTVFAKYPNIDNWKVEFTAVAVYSSATLTGSSSLLFIKNKLPLNGSCSVDLTNGTAMSTYFTISCENWYDPDGTIKTYEFYVTYLNSPSPLALSYNSAGILSIQLPQGPKDDAYKVELIVQVIDDADGITVHRLSQTVYVLPNDAKTNSLMDELLSNDPNSGFLQTLKGGSLQACGQQLVSFSSMLNMQADSASSTTSNSSTDATSTTGFTQADPATDKRSKVRDILMDTVDSIVPSDMSSAKVIASALSAITGQISEVSLNSAKKAVDKTIALLEVMNQNSGKVPLPDVLVGAYGMIDGATNSLASMSGKILGKIGLLSSDVADEETIKQQMVDAQKKIDEQIMGSLKNIISSYMSVNQTTTINSGSIKVEYTKQAASSVSSQVSAGDGGSFSMPDSFCDMYFKATGFSNCSNDTVVTSQVTSRNMPTAGVNGKSEAKVGMSRQTGISYSDAKNNPIKIKNLKNKISFYVYRDPELSSVVDLSFNFINTSNKSDPSLYLTNQMLVYSFELTGANNSIQIQVKPAVSSLSVGYLMALKFGSAPVINSSSSSFDYAKLSCPSDMRADGSDKFHQFFLNMSLVNGHKGIVGLGIRQLTQAEMATYCYSGNSSLRAGFLTNPPLTDPTSIVFNSSLLIRMITSGCFYLDEKSNWRTDGVEVLEDGTNSTSTHCETEHFTEFAGGFVVLPPPIDFNYAFANASFEKNALIYMTVIGVTALYIVLAIWAFYADRKDRLKTGICVLSDNNQNLPVESSYYYELMVYTGTRKNAATDSNVSFVLSGEKGETDVRSLSNTDTERKILRRGGVDSFIMNVDKPLGPLTYLRIWHDNSGRGDLGSWFLKFVIVHDLQTREKYYFICQQWLAVEKEDGQVDRLLPVSCDEQKTELKYLLQKQAKNSLSDGHLWFSIFARPVQSAFTRLDRLTCCVVLLFLSMLMNIMYYGLKEEGSDGGLKIGPFSLTPEQIGIGLMTNLIVFPPSFLLLQLFRRSRKRQSKSKRLRKILDNLERKQTSNNREFTNVQTSQFVPTPAAPAVKVKKPMTFPWWFKIIAYGLAFIFSGVSAFFIIIQGITFGQEKVSKWLTSLLLSVLSSILLTQPLQIALVTLFFVVIFRKNDDKLEIENDNEDDGKSINSKYVYKQSKQDEFSPCSKTLQQYSYQRMDEEELNEARDKRMREVKIWKLLREIASYGMFIWILVIVSYTNKDTNSYNYQLLIKNSLSQGPVQLDQVNTLSDIWRWANQVLVPNLKSSATFYNGNPSGLGSYYSDFSSVVISYPILRQIRVENNSCALAPSIQPKINFCTDQLGVFNSEKSDFGTSWSQLDQSLQTNPLMTNIYSAFRYTHALDIDSYPFSGVYTSYAGGGFVYKLIGSESELNGNLSSLESMGWLDRQSRALFVEFSLFNPSINMFAYCNVLFEILANGEIIPQVRISPFTLYQFNQNFASLTIACDIIYLVYICWFMFKEIKEMIKLKRQYFKRFWSYVEWIIIGFSWAALAMYLYRLYSSEKIGSKIKSNNPSAPTLIQLQLSTYWNEALGYCLAFCACLGTIKFLKLLRFNKRIAMFIMAMKTIVKELVSFMLLFMIVFLAFVQLMFLTLNEATVGFSTFVKAMETCFAIILGNFQVAPILEANSLLGPLYFAFYNIAIIFILLNIFLTIVNDAFAKVRAEVGNSEKDELDVVGYLATEIRNLLPFSGQVEPEEQPGKAKNGTVYKDQLTSFPQKVDDLLNLLVEIHGRKSAEKF